MIPDGMGVWLTGISSIGFPFDLHNVCTYGCCMRLLVCETCSPYTDGDVGFALAVSRRDVFSERQKVWFVGAPGSDSVPDGLFYPVSAGL